jgi:hypothetical protein
VKLKSEEERLKKFRDEINNEKLQLEQQRVAVSSYQSIHSFRYCCI